MQKSDTFLRWVGSKRLLISYIKRFIPNEIINYHEPFLGSGIVFFQLIDCKKAYLSDLNEPLINCFIQLKENVYKVIEELGHFHNSKEAFLKEREKTYKEDFKRAAHFIFLNRTSFNGIYRVNQKGNYNVPYGYRVNVDLVTPELLLSVHKKLQSTEINCHDFEQSISNISQGDFVYIDPPYVASHQNNGFLEYNQKLFSWEDQIRLHHYIQVLENKKVCYLLSNAAHETIKSLYKDIREPIIVTRYSKIGGKGAWRGQINEFLFTNLV